MFKAPSEKPVGDPLLAWASQEGPALPTPLPPGVHHVAGGQSGFQLAVLGRVKATMLPSEAVLLLQTWWAGSGQTPPQARCVAGSSLWPPRAPCPLPWLGHCALSLAAGTPQGAGLGVSVQGDWVARGQGQCFPRMHRANIILYVRCEGQATGCTGWGLCGREVSAREVGGLWQARQHLQVPLTPRTLCLCPAPEPLSPFPPTLLAPVLPLASGATPAGTESPAASIFS